MRDYPPEYDEPCVENIPTNLLPAWLDPNVYWDEDGRVFVMRKDNGDTITVFDDAEALPELAQYDAPETDPDARALEKVLAHTVTRFALEQDRIRDLSYRLEDAVEQSRRYHRENIPTFDEFWKDIEPYVGLEASEAGDWVPEWCDSCHTWHKRAYCVEFVIEDGERMVKVGNVDTDGDWDYSFYGASDWDYCYLTHILTDEHFKSWAEYHLWCADNGGIDPLEEFYKTSTVEGHLEAVEDNIRFAFPYGNANQKGD